MIAGELVVANVAPLHTREQQPIFIRNSLTLPLGRNIKIIQQRCGLDVKLGKVIRTLK
jgi:hypothetical protein